jgi:hypothetical protein
MVDGDRTLPENPLPHPYVTRDQPDVERLMRLTSYTSERGVLEVQMLRAAGLRPERWHERFLCKRFHRHSWIQCHYTFGYSGGLFGISTPKRITRTARCRYRECRCCGFKSVSVSDGVTRIREVQEYA